MQYLKPIKPMMAVNHHEPFDSSDYLFEIKWDGYRCLAYCDDEIRLYSRNCRNITRRFSEIAADLKSLKEHCVLDGELIILDADGKPSFSKLQYKKNCQYSCCFIVFDLLYIDKKPLLNQSLMERRQKLTKFFSNNQYLTRVLLSHAVEDQGVNFFRAITEYGLEGMMAKKKNSHYLPGIRSIEWLKIKNRRELDAVIIGYLPGTYGFKSLVLAQYDQDTFNYIGSVGTGFSQKENEALFKGLKRIVSVECPLKLMPSELNRAVWVKPILVATIEYLEFTPDGRLRQPSFIRLRDDKSPAECVYKSDTEK